MFRGIWLWSGVQSSPAKVVLKVRLHSQQESTKTEQAMTQTEHGVLNQQSETENKDVDKLKEELLNLTQERDTYKMKLDEFQNHLEAAKVGIHCTTYFSR